MAAAAQSFLTMTFSCKDTQVINIYTSPAPANPSACLLVGALGSKNGFSARLVTLVPCLGAEFS